MESNLKNKAVSGVFWTALQRFGKMGISFVVNLIMARLLMPEDYGAIGISCFPQDFALKKLYSC